MAATSQSTTQIRQKVRAPALPADHLPRPRVVSSLRHLFERYPVVLISATAGAGKTTAVVEAARESRLPLAWLSLDPTDAAPGRLLTYVEAALNTQSDAVGDVVKRALASGAHQLEAAGLLAEALGDTRLLLVIDEVERLAPSPRAVSLISAFLRYAPPGLTTVLVSRRDVDFDLPASVGYGRVARFGEEQLAFTVEEARGALELRGAADVDPTAAVAATGGWVTGVLFEAWRSADHVFGTGGDADPLHGYLASQILAALTAAQRQFLVDTSVLTDISVERAQALGVDDAAALLASLHVVRLPATWAFEGRVLRCHPRFREYLLECLGRAPTRRLRSVRLAFAELLADEGEFEDATEEFLSLGETDRARACAEHAITGVVERLDLDIAERWLMALSSTEGYGSQVLTKAKLMVAVGREEFVEAARTCDELRAILPASEPIPSELAALMGWCYWLVERYEDHDAVLSAGEPGPALELIRWASAVEMMDREGDYEDVPAVSGGPLDAIALRLHWIHGRLERLLDAQTSSWVDAVQKPWQVWALIALGRHADALALAEDERSRSCASLFFEACVQPELLLAAGRPVEAWSALLSARERVAAAGSGYITALQLAVEAKLALRLNRDPAHSRAVLERIAAMRVGRDVQQVVDEYATWMGFTLLLEEDAGSAAAILRHTLDRLVARDRLLHVPTVATYLAEAEWRLGNEDVGDAVMDLALQASERIGSPYLLLAALRDFPAVVSRRIDAEPSEDSVWHQLGRQLLKPHGECTVPLTPVVRVCDFGPAQIFVGDVPQKPRIAKSVELLVYLICAPEQRASRDEILDDLFEGRADESTKSYLRQAVARLREILPDGVLQTSRSAIALKAGAVSSDSLRFRQMVDESGRLGKQEAVALLTDAFALSDRGEFLEGARSIWAESHREALARLALEARLDAADWAFDLGSYRQAEALVDAVVQRDPYRERAWRLRMKLLGALGDSDALVRCYQRCSATLASIGLEPAPSTRRLVDHLRR